MDRDAVSQYRVTSVVAMRCSFDLPQPIVLHSGLTIRSREYVAVRVATAGGVEGHAWSLSRGAPVDRVIDDLLSPLLVGFDSREIADFHQRAEAQLAMLGTDGIVQRGLSLLDIALWDARGKALGEPVWRLLGGARRELPALLVDSYPAPGQEVGAALDELLQHVDAGHTALKLHYANGVGWLTSLVAQLREALGQEFPLVIDAATAFRDPPDAISAIGQWQPYTPAWVEDPFRGDRTAWMRRTRDAIGVPLGGGDEVASPRAIEALIAAEAVDVVRLDATCHGGITGFARLAAVATAAGCAISPHTYPEVHAHLALALPQMSHLELFAPGSRYDCSEAFLRSRSTRARNGQASAGDEPGLGVQIDWDAVQGNLIGAL